MEITKAILDFIQNTAKSLEPSAQKLLDVYVRQAYMEGIVDLIKAGVFFVLIIIATIIAIKVWKSFTKTVKEAEEFNRKLMEDDKYHSHRDYREDFDGWQYGFVIIYGIVLTLLGLLCIGYLTEGIKEINNPMYYAIQNILNSIKK